MRPDDRWLYLSKLRWVKCVSYANQAGPFVGSGFAYEDIGAQELEKYTNRKEDLLYRLYAGRFWRPDRAEMINHRSIVSLW